MRTSDSIKELATALAKAQGELSNPKKDTANTFFKSKYADLAGHVEAIRACFPKYGLSYTQGVVTKEREVGVETLIMHESGEWIAHEPFYLPVNKEDAQGFVSSVTYARRCSLSSATGTAPEDDDGNAAAAAKPLSKAIPANIEGQDILAGMPPEEQKFLRDYAMEIIGLHDGKGDVMGYLDQHKLDTEEKLALWGLLPSNVRSSIKTAQREMAVNGRK